MKLTSELIHAAASDNGGWNKAQLELLGVQWPPVQGWLRSLEGREIQASVYAQVLALRGVKPKARKKLLKRERQPELL